MGGAASRFAETDWDKNDGGLREPSETLDGRKPTSSHAILTLKKSDTLVNQRQFDIRNDVDELLYHSKAMEGTTKWFQLFDSQGRPLFCIQTDASRSEWRMYSYSPNWEGQVVDMEATAATSSSETYLYRKAQIDIAWNKYHGEVRIFAQNDSDALGVLLHQEPILRCEEVASITAQFQSYVPRVNLLDNALHPPLVGWWVWEDTKQRHQLKMHLAKGTDLALQCILAITCNMVNVEKQADKIQ